MPAPHKGRVYYVLRCPVCGIKFERERRQTHFVKGGAHTFCSRRCVGISRGRGLRVALLEQEIIKEVVGDAKITSKKGNTLILEEI